MENQTRYDLNAAVENWRNELAAQPNLAPDDRRELETHLRDAIAGFQQRGLNDEESFWLARRRVGQPQQIGEEFAKTNPTAVWRERLFWMLNALLFLNLWGRFTGTILMRHTDFNIPITNFLNGLAYIVLVFCCVIFISNNRLQNGVKSLGYIFQSRTTVSFVWVAVRFGSRFCNRAVRKQIYHAANVFRAVALRFTGEFFAYRINCLAPAATKSKDSKTRLKQLWKIKPVTI